jgi:hypothetical protein
MLSRLQRPAHRADVNWAPLSDVMVAGTPNRDQLAKRALAHSAAVMDEREWPLATLMFGRLL